MTREEFEGLLRSALAVDCDGDPYSPEAAGEVLGAWDAQASALAEARMLGACEKCGKEGPTVLPFWCEACAAGTLGQMDDYWKRIAVAESRAAEAEARLARVEALVTALEKKGPAGGETGVVLTGIRIALEGLDGASDGK